MTKVKDFFLIYLMGIKFNKSKHLEWMMILILSGQGKD
jgi:hypothetical protein